MDKNFEKELGRKLSERTIAPSANAWERVNLQRGRKQKKHTYIYWIAAILVLGLGITVFFNSGRQAEIRPQVVNVETSFEKEPLPQTVHEVTTPTKVASQETQKKPTQNGSAPTVLTEPKQGLRQSALAIASADLARSQPETKIISEVNVTIGSGKKTNQDDVDLLLQKARKEIASGHGLSQPTDANALLKDSESELDENFRSGIIENLFKQKRIRVAFGNN